MRTIRIVLLSIAAMAAGCRQDQPADRDHHAKPVDEQVRAKWGRSFDELPVAKLAAISAHNQDIQNEFTRAFSLHHAVNFGQRVQIEWRDVGGGSTSIETYLLNVYQRSNTSQIDILWGGGEFTFARLATDGLLERLQLADDVLANVPDQLGGVQMRDPQQRWIGSAVSGFGFLYNSGMLRSCGLAAPAAWDDLGHPRLADLLALADPTQSGSAAAAYRMIVVSEPDWPAGWAKLLATLANAKRFYDSAGSAANAPALGEALVATCIDFYGTTRVAEAPDDLVYVSPEGQTTFSPDPIGILKNPPNPALARRMVDFVMSQRGQALWALPVGHPDGPTDSQLGRQPIRSDVYRTYAGQFSPWIVNPYKAGQALQVRPEMEKVNFTVLRMLVACAAVDNLGGLRAARNKLIQTHQEATRLAEFNRLPEDVDTLDKMAAVSRQVKDPKQLDLITTGWKQFFRRKYDKVAE